MKQKDYKRLTKDPAIRARIREQLEAYQRMNEIVEEESIRELKNMSADESRAIFIDLCQSWEHSFEQNPSLGDLEREHIEDLLEYRRVFNYLGTQLAKEV